MYGGAHIIRYFPHLQLEPEGELDAAPLRELLLLPDAHHRAVRAEPVPRHGYGALDRAGRPPGTVQPVIVHAAEPLAVTVLAWSALTLRTTPGEPLDRAAARC